MAKNEPRKSDESRDKQQDTSKQEIKDLDVPDKEAKDVGGGIIPPDLLARLADEGKG
jgi:hypothetical protein